MDKKIEDLIYFILKDAPYKCYSGWYKEDYSSTTVTVFLCTNEIDVDYSDDDEEGVIYNFQFSTFSKNKEEAIKQRKYTRKVLKENGFIKQSESNESYETETELHHLADRFIYYVPSES